MKDSTYSLLAGVIAHLEGDSPPRFAWPIYDQAPQDAAKPYMTTGETQALAWEAQCIDGAESYIEFHTWDNSHRARTTVLMMNESLVQALHGQKFALPGTDAVQLVELESSRSFWDRDGLTMHGVVSFRVYTTTDH